VLHLHGLEHQQGRAALDGAWPREQPQHAPGHRRTQVALLRARPGARRELIQHFDGDAIFAGEHLPTRAGPDHHQRLTSVRALQYEGRVVLPRRADDSRGRVLQLESRPFAVPADRDACLAAGLAAQPEHAARGA